MLYQRTNCKKKANVKQPLTFHAWYTVLRANEIKMKIKEKFNNKKKWNERITAMAIATKLQRKQQMVSNFRLFPFKCTVCSFISSNFVIFLFFVLYLFNYLVTLVFFSLFNVILLTDFLISQNITLHIHCNCPLFYLFFQCVYVCMSMFFCVCGWVNFFSRMCNFWC